MQLTIRMPDEYKEKLDLLSKKTGLKRSDVVRLALKHFIEENNEDISVTSFDKVSHLLGVADSGIKDLGQRHRYYLIQRIRKGS